MSDLSFEAFVRALGLRPGIVVPDGRWRRCSTESHPRKKNGSYKLADDGKRGWVRDWAVMSEHATWRAGGDSDAAEEYDPEAMAAARLEWATREGRRRHYVREAVRAYYNAASPLLEPHPYLVGHGLDMRGTQDLRVDADGWLVVPAYMGGRHDLASVQRISATGKKLYWEGAPMQGASIVFSHWSPTVTVFCEGVATALALYCAVPNARVVCCFDSGNLERTTDRPLGLVVVAADNDHATAARIGTNPGMKAALRAAEATGAGVAAPQGIQGSDWCDYRLERIAERVKRKGDFVTRGQIERAVDGEIKQAIMGAARYVGSAEAVSA